MEFQINKNIMSMGSLEVITGSMFSGKSEELIRRLRRAKYAKQKIVVFSPSIDNRYGEKGIYSHGKESLEAYSVNSVNQMEEIMTENIDAQVIGIDEVQFLGEDVVRFCKKYVEYGKRIIVAGLDLSFRAEPYHPVPELMSISDRVDKLNAICTVCGKPAYASQRLINGEPAYYDDPLVMVGASENYEARCRRHHIVKHKEEEKGKILFVIGTEIDAGKKEVEENASEVSKNDFSLVDLRNKVGKAISENDCVFIRIIGGLLLPLEGYYSILDFICEYRKKSEIVIVAKNKKGLLNQVLLTVDLLKKSDLNIGKIIYKNGNDEKEHEEVLEEIKDITHLEYEFVN